MSNGLPSNPAELRPESALANVLQIETLTCTSPNKGRSPKAPSRLSDENKTLISLATRQRPNKAGLAKYFIYELTVCISTQTD